ncbi:MAG: hypothetical protein JSS83_10475 [Cyanobacteria bacterium SZAS LIN-3]|nr:hypothetical protein [Cyanobacteria bacterium SZAS LIN-3]
MLSDRQKFNFMLGLIALCVIGSYPPWRLYGEQSKPLGFAPIYDPPTSALAPGMPGKIDIDFSRLGLEALVVSILTGGLLVIGAGGAGSSARVGAKPAGGFMARLAEAQAQAREAMLASQEAQRLAQQATAPAAAAASASSSSTSAVDPRYTRVELPANYYLGELLIESDDDPDYWDSFCPAKGVVDLPKGKKIQLELAKDIRVDLAFLAAFPSGSIHSIDASECKLTDEDVSKLTVMSGLKELDLTGTPITSTSVSKLRALGRLERLWLDRTLINDECVPALASLSKLKKLSLSDTKLNDLSLETLRKDLASCEVVTG